MTVVAAAAFVWFYEATIPDSKFSMLPLRFGAVTRPPAACPRACASPFSATAYCKGLVTSAGVAAQTGVAAADPSLLPLGSVVELDMQRRQVRRHLHGPRYRSGDPGARSRHLHVELLRGARDSAAAPRS